MKLCDVTLREGDQMPGRSYTADQKVTAGTALDRLGIDYLQAGFPITGERDREVVRSLAGSVDAEVIGLARARTEDVDAAIDADADVVEVIVGVSERQLTHVVGKTRSAMLEALREAVDLAHDRGASVHVTVVDAFRTDEPRLFEVFDLVEDVELVALADTVGIRTPGAVRRFLDTVGREVALDRVGVHFHDDLGVATANALEAIAAGVARVDASVASLGERAGNPAIEEVIVATALSGETPFDVATEELVPVCRRVLDVLDEAVSPRKSILGAEVTSHESGLHTAAMLEDPSVFEPYDPSRFGGERTLLFGEGSGTSSARKLLDLAGVEPTEAAVDRLTELLDERGPLSLEEAVSLAERELT